MICCHYIICIFHQGIHNRLQNEKSRLATAITACETATASISRPSSPMDSEHGTEATQKENDAKIKLEDLIDQVCWTLCFCHLLNFEFQILCG